MCLCEYQILHIAGMQTALAVFWCLWFALFLIATTYGLNNQVSSILELLNDTCITVIHFVNVMHKISSGTYPRIILFLALKHAKEASSSSFIICVWLTAMNRCDLLLGPEGTWLLHLIVVVITISSLYILIKLQNKENSLSLTI
jgi:hypothetical protein